MLRFIYSTLHHCSRTFAYKKLAHQYTSLLCLFVCLVAVVFRLIASCCFGGCFFFCFFFCCWFFVNGGGGGIRFLTSAHTSYPGMTDVTLSV